MIPVWVLKETLNAAAAFLITLLSVKFA